MQPDITREILSFRWSGPNPMTGEAERFTIRGIRPDGSYYGTAFVYETGQVERIESVDGVLTTDANQRLSELAQALVDSNVDDATGGATAALGIGAIGSASLVLDYTRADEKNIARSEMFEEIGEIFRNAIAQAD